MKRAWKNKDAVSPVIATILMVAITVVLAAVLYVMVIGMGGDTDIETPLGLSQQSRTATTVSVLVADAPADALVDGTAISLVHDGTPTAITSATIYWANATIAATYIAGTWTYLNGATAATLDFTAGMTIVVTAGSISNGDDLTFSSTEGYYGTSTLQIS